MERSYSMRKSITIRPFSMMHFMSCLMFVCHSVSQYQYHLLSSSFPVARRSSIKSPQSNIPFSHLIGPLLSRPLLSRLRRCVIVLLCTRFILIADIVCGCRKISSREDIFRDYKGVTLISNFG